MTTSPARRHVWVDSSGGYQYPGLLMAWRRSPDGGWEAQVALVQLETVLVEWVAASALHLVTDDRWAERRRPDK